MMLKINHELLAWNDDQLLCYNDIPFTGIAVEVGSHGIFELEYRDGLEHGESRRWYPHGVLHMRYQCQRGAFCGVYEEFYPDGSVKASGCYEVGVVVEMHEYDDGGRETKHYLISPDDPCWPAVQAYRKSKSSGAGSGG